MFSLELINHRLCYHMALTILCLALIVDSPKAINHAHTKTALYLLKSSEAKQK